MFSLSKTYRSGTFFDNCRRASVRPNELRYVVLGVNLDFPCVSYIRPYLCFDYRTPHVRGWVADQNPHITLLSYALETQGHQQLLQGLQLPEKITIEKFITFENQYRFCVVALVNNNSILKQASCLLEKHFKHLPDERDYMPHIAVAYLNKNIQMKDRLLSDLNYMYKDKQFSTTTTFVL